MADIQSSSHEDLEFDGQEMTIFEDGNCWLVALDDWEIAAILSSLRFAHWQRRWRNLGGHSWDEIEAKITQLEHCLMAGCNIDELLDKFDTLNINLGDLLGRFTHNDKNIAQWVSELVTGQDTEGLIEAINNLSEQFIFRTGEEQQDTATILNLIKEKIVDLNQDVLSYDQKGIAQILEELPIPSLTQAVENLELVANCSPDVNLTCSPDVIVNTIGGGGEIGTVLPSDPDANIGQETPPTNYGDPQTDELKCKIANKLIDECKQALQDFIDGNVLWYIQAGGVLSGLYLILVNLLFTILTGGTGYVILGISAGSIIGYLKDFLFSFVSLENGDLAELIDFLDDNKEDLVCILYNAENGTSVLEVKSQFNDILVNAGASEAQIALVNCFLTIEVFYMIWWKPAWQGTQEGYETVGDYLEAQLDGYVGSVDCGVCIDDCELTMTFGTGDLTPDGTQRTLSAVPTSGNLYSLQVDQVGECSCHDYEFEFTGGSPQGLMSAQRCDGSYIYHDTSRTLGAETWCCKWWYIQTGSPFSVNVIIRETCS